MNNHEDSAEDASNDAESFLYGNADAETETFLQQHQDQDPTASIDFDFATVAREVGDEMSLDEARSLIKARKSAEASPPLITRPPTAEFPAEVLAIVSSLKGSVTSYFSSLRLQHFLGRKRILFVLVDINKDVIRGRNLRNSDLLANWELDDLLVQNGEGRIQVPQCLIDGVSVGDEVALQDLEEEGDLDLIINRFRCPNCFADRQEPGAPGECFECGRFLGPVIPEQYFQSDEVYHVFNDQRIEWDSELPLPGERIPNEINFRPLDDLRPYEIDY